MQNSKPENWRKELSIWKAKISWLLKYPTQTNKPKHKQTLDKHGHHSAVRQKEPISE